MDPFVQPKRRSREFMYEQAASANARASKRLSAKLKTLESQKQSQIVKLHKDKFRMKNALSMSSLYVNQESSGPLSTPISPRPPSSLPVSPITSPPCAPRRRLSEVMASRALRFKGQALGNSNGNTAIKKAGSEGKLLDAQELESYTAKELIHAGMSPRPFRKISFSDFEQFDNKGIAKKTHEVLLLHNKGTKSTLPTSASLIAINENRNSLENCKICNYQISGDSLDQRIKKFHESLLAYKREKEEADEVFDEDDQKEKGFSDSIPKLPDIKPYTSRTKSLPSLFPRLSLSNLNLKSSKENNDSFENLKECRYLRIPGPGELSTDEVFSHEGEA